MPITPDEVEHLVLAWYRRLDPRVDEGVGLGPVSCKAGCAHCCYQQTALFQPEGMAIAVEVARLPDWQVWAERLVEAARLACQPESLEREAWFERHVPCPFLTSENLCRIYERRPAACRWHRVATPSANCAFGAEDPIVHRYDTSSVDGLLMGLCLDFHRELGTAVVVGPLPLMVLLEMAKVLGRADRRWLAARTNGLLSPQEWMRRRAEQAAQDDPLSLLPVIR
jgi:Fe-S-cluster containining protein